MTGKRPTQKEALQIISTHLDILCNHMPADAGKDNPIVLRAEALLDVLDLLQNGYGDNLTTNSQKWL